MGCCRKLAEVSKAAGVGGPPAATRHRKAGRLLGAAGRGAALLGDRAGRQACWGDIGGAEELQRGCWQLGQCSACRLLTSCVLEAV